MAVSGVIPDIDGIGLVYDLIIRNGESPLHFWSKFHPVVGHNIGFGLFWTFVVFLSATRRRLAAGAALLGFHLHLLCDFLGSKGPDGYQRPIPYLLPFSDSRQLVWSGQWELNAWPNFLITGLIVCYVLYQAWKRGISPVEIFSVRANEALVRALRNRFGNPL